MQLRTFNPREPQKVIIDHVMEHKRCAVWASVGFGKTAATLFPIKVLQLLEPTPTLVLAPLRVARDTWGVETQKWANLKDVEVQPIVGTLADRTRAIRNTNAPVFTINYENIPWLVEVMGDKWPFKVIVADEATRLKSLRIDERETKSGGISQRKSGGGMRAMELARVAWGDKVERFIELTGTPAPNGLLDLWGQFFFLDRGARLGKNFSSFRDRWFQKGYDGYSYEPFPHSEQQIHDAVGDIAVSLNPKDWFDLKDPIRNVVTVKLPPKALAHYREMEKQFFTEIDSNDVEAFNAAAKSSKLLQIASGAVYTDDEKNWAEVHDAKIQALDSIIEESAGVPVMVAYHFKSDLVRLKKAFPKGIDLSTTDGLAKAMKGHPGPWFAHPASLGHGVDGLQNHCNILVFFTTDWNLENHDQIIGRIGPTRQMQAGFERPVWLHYLCAEGTIDFVAVERQDSKRAVMDCLLDAKRRRSA